MSDRCSPSDEELASFETNRGGIYQYCFRNSYYYITTDFFKEGTRWKMTPKALEDRRRVDPPFFPKNVPKPKLWEIFKRNLESIVS